MRSSKRIPITGKSDRTGFTIIEAMLAVMLMAAASAMVFSVTIPSMDQTFRQRDHQIAKSFSDTLFAEILIRPIITTSPNVAGQTPDGYQSRLRLKSIRSFHNYASKLCLSDGTPVSALAAGSALPRIDSLFCKVTVVEVGNDLQPGSGTKFLKITVAIFRQLNGDSVSENGSNLHTQSICVAI